MDISQSFDTNNSEHTQFDHKFLNVEPYYDDMPLLIKIVSNLSQHPPLVPIHEIVRLSTILKHAYTNHGFLIQIGDCAERFNPPSDYVKVSCRLFDDFWKTVEGSVLGPCVMMGRIAGQYAKPRTHATEIIHNEEIPSFYGESVNGELPSERSPDPRRMLMAHDHATQTLKSIRKELESAQYILKMGETLFTSHEAYLLPYEYGLRHIDSRNTFGTSAHFLWIGERTRNPNNAHIKFARTLSNPIGIKIGSSVTPEEALALCNILNPNKKPGHLSFIVRFGHDKIESCFPPLLKAVKDYPILWICDPMHGNTKKIDTGQKVRYFGDILAETDLFFECLLKEKIAPSGIHCEASGYQRITECLDQTITADGLTHYETACDPRLNYTQALALAAICKKKLMNHYNR